MDFFNARSQILLMYSRKYLTKDKSNLLLILLFVFTVIHICYSYELRVTLWGVSLRAEQLELILNSNLPLQSFLNFF